MAWYRRDGSGQGSREKGAVGAPTFVERETNQTARRRAVASSRWSAETGARRLCGNTSGWRRAWGIRQVRLGVNGGGRDRGAPWKPVALKGGARQSCSVAMERVGTRSVVGGFGEKCRDRKGMTRLQRGGLGEKAAANRIKRLLLLPMDGIDSLGCPLPKARGTNWEGGGRCRGSLGGGTVIFSGACRPQNHCPR